MSLDATTRRLSRSSGLPAREIEALAARGVVVDVADERHERITAGRLRRARRLRRDLGLTLDAVAIVMRLLDRIDQLEGRG